MKKTALFLLLFIPMSVAFGQSDKKSREILKGLSQKYKTYKSLTATFSLIVEDKQLKKVQEQKGTLFLKGNKYKLQIAGQDIISDGKTRWTFVKDANEIQIDNQKPEQEVASPSNIFTIYEKGWHSKFTGEQKVMNVNCQMIELIPADGKAKNVFKVKLAVNKDQKSIASLKIFDRNGTIQTITVDKFIPDAASDESLYVFSAEKYPGTDIIDLR